ncbi:VTT domain-containing protein [Aquisalimonas sp.]|uniref:VTT domain-containing protein n=1 Tax=unclassified Aquisalimonas TaxID=2644645 RepID=UPI0025C540F4|nr:VTT domain-containing protein [Aquisalimonas sp.]
MRHSLAWRSILLVVLLGVGLVLALWQPVSLETLVATGEEYARKPWAMVGSVVLLAVFFVFALPGSLVFWLIAPFHPPVVAVPMLLAGSLPGCLGAYWVASALSTRLRNARSAAGVIAFMRKRSDMLSQCALRVLPGFPHAAVNYAAGVLRVGLPGFVVAIVIGLGIKWSLYATAVYGAIDAIRRGEGVDGGTIMLMGGIAVLMVVAAWMKRRTAGSR